MATEFNVWLPKEFKAYTPGVLVPLYLSYDETGYFIDNGREFKQFPLTPAGWNLLCEELKGMSP